MSAETVRAEEAVGGAAGRFGGPLVAVASVVILGAIMAILDTTIVNVALDSLAREFGTGISTIQWVVSAYTLALATVIPLSGWATDRFGPKRLWMVSVGLFVLGSALCALAWSPLSLILFRVLQGLGGGMIMPVGITVLVRAAGPGRLGRVMSAVGLPTVLAPVLGPVIGGFLVEGFSWRSIFLVNLPLGALALLLAWRLLPADRPSPSERLDFLGLALLSPGLAALIFGLSGTSGGGVGALDDPGVLFPLIAGAVLVAAFVARTLGARAPLVDLRLFRGRVFSAAAATGFVVALAMFGTLLLLPLFFQQVRGEGAFSTGLLLAPQGIGTALSMVFAGRLADRLGAGRVVPVGLAVAAVGTAAFALVGPETPYVVLGAALVVQGAGLGATMMPAMAAAYATLDEAGVSRATTALQIIQQVGGSVGAAAFAVALQLGLSGSAAVDGGVAPDAAAGAHAAVFWLGAGVLLAGLVPALLLPMRPPTSSAGGDAAARAPGDAAPAAAPAVSAAAVAFDCHPAAGSTAFASAFASSNSPSETGLALRILVSIAGASALYLLLLWLMLQG